MRAQRRKDIRDSARGESSANDQDRSALKHSRAEGGVSKIHKRYENCSFAFRTDTAYRILTNK
jgi:hypothetical protein